MTLREKTNLKKNNFDRKSGILLHITSLPSSSMDGIGTLGREAYAFVDFLKRAGQTLWQILPLGPTGYGDSPYASSSSFAGNPLLIDLNSLVEKNWACKDDIVCPDFIKTEGNVDYGAVVFWKIPVLYKCASYFLENACEQDKLEYESFKKSNKLWLDDFALFTNIKEFYDKKAQSENVTGSMSCWNVFWPKNLARHEKEALKNWTKEHSSGLELIKVIQFFFFSQWFALKKYAGENNIKIIGDIPIFVAAESADLWANQQLFQLNRKTLAQKTCAGVPPDYFSATGQLWGNPLYDWKAIKESSWLWWINRIKHMMKLTDIVRIDHFRGFEAYWKVPYGETTAINGKWAKGPGVELFEAVKAKCKGAEIVAEDLGLITPKVKALRDKCGFPGMKILQFAFNENEWNEESGKNAYLPENFETENCVVYTGTHDNNTTLGQLKDCPARYAENVRRWLKLEDSAGYEELTEGLVKSAFESKAKYCIILMQDVLLKDSDCRMNTPSSCTGNWSWRMKKGELTEEKAQWLKELSCQSHRNAF